MIENNSQIMAAQLLHIDLVPRSFTWYIANNVFQKGIPTLDGKGWCFGPEPEKSDETPDMKEVVWKGPMKILMSDGEYTDIIERKFSVEPDTKEDGITRGHLIDVIHSQMLRNLDVGEKAKLCGNPQIDEDLLKNLTSEMPMSVADLGTPGMPNTFDYLDKETGEEHFTLRFTQRF